ncbi:hypothetical protein O181_120608 [Austropuccinia psidii MF-1]|uniref:Uncharacterized protein n=1 Tax=Austropuccinia psidii MF-1 TaxID=1389203 RepID=A0A9Q3Q0H5_9BASI|nr:hypothetical protein [Austropuccinia psidii MF-1]
MSCLCSGYESQDDTDCTEIVPNPVGASQGTRGRTLSQSNKPVSHQYEPYLLVIMQQMTQSMANVQGVSSCKAFKNPFMKAPYCFNGTQPFKVRRFIHSCQLIFHNDQANFP